MASRSARVIRGIRIPFAALFTSSMAEGSGGVASVLMDTWAMVTLAKREKNKKAGRRVFMGLGLLAGEKIRVTESQSHRVFFDSMCSSGLSGRRECSFGIMDFFFIDRPFHRDLKVLGTSE